MPIIFKPNGILDVSSDPTDLPDVGLTRCKNLRVDRVGFVQTRDGSSKINSSALGQISINRIIEQVGTRYSFAGTNIYKDESSIKASLTSAQWSAILYNSFNSSTQNVFALNGTDRKRIEGANVYEWGITPPATAPTIAVGASTGLTGDYNIKYTYARYEGTTLVSESDPSDSAASAVTLANESLIMTWTASSDSQVTHVRIYRTLTSGVAYYFLSAVAIGTTTLDDGTADASLGTQVASNHDRPPLGSVVFGPTYNGTCFILIDNLLYYCLPKQPEYWPVTYFIEVSEKQFPLKAGCFYNGQPFVASKNNIYLIQGTGHNSFFPHTMSSITGAQNENCFLPIAGSGIYHVGSDGIYVFDGVVDTKISERNLEVLFRGTDKNGMPGVSSTEKSWLIQYRNKIYFSYTSAGYAYPTNIITFSLEDSRISYYTYGREIRCVTVDETNNRILAGDNSGFVWELEDRDAINDAGTAIPFDLESKEYTLQTRSHFPRWAKYDVDASDNACTANGYVYLDGELLQTHALTGNRNTRRRLISTGNGERVSHRISGSGVVKIHMVESE